MRSASAALFTIGLIALFACSSSSSKDDATSELPEACKSIEIDRFKSLLIVDESVLGDARARNDVGGPWSFRRRMEDLAPPGLDGSSNTVAFLSTWKVSAKINLFDVPVRGMVQQRALCNWLRSTPGNACDASCGTCAAKTYDLAYAPFRLIAIANRADLLTSDDDPTMAGEGRFLYALTDGPGDDPASAPLNMTIIFEYRQPLRGRTRGEVVEQWHALTTKHPTLDEAYKLDLDGLLKTFYEPGAEPGRPLGSALNQVRVNEREFEWQWSMREYGLGEGGLALRNLENTPDASLNGTPQLARFINDNREALLAFKHVVPDTLTGGEVGILQPWTAPGVDSSVLRAFSRETCNGCHQIANLDFNFHVSPHKKGIEKLSPFMNDPAKPEADELGFRETFMRRQLCGAK